MKKILLFFFTTSLYAGDPTFNAFVKNPDDKTLATFKIYCDKNSVDYDGNGDGTSLIQGALETGNLNLLKALIYSIPTKDSKRCADGASLELLKDALGNDILLNHPAALIQAMYQENRFDITSIVRESSLRIAKCTKPSCKKLHKSFYAKKRSALLNAKLPEKYKPLRASLLKEIKGM